MNNHQKETNTFIDNLDLFLAADKYKDLFFFKSSHFFMFYYFHHSVHRAAREGDAEWSKAAGTRDRRGRPSHPRAQKPCRQVSWAAIAETITPRFLHLH